MTQTCPIQKGRPCTSRCPFATRVYPDLPLAAGFECAVKALPGMFSGLFDISISLDKVARALDRIAEALTTKDKPEAKA